AAQVESVFGTMVAQSPAGDWAGNLAIVSYPDGLGLIEDGEAATDRFAKIDAVVGELFHLAVRQLIAARPDLLWIHGGVMVCGDRAVLLSAVSGQGKSTLVAHLAARGWTYFSDEIAAIDAATRTVLSFPVTPYMRAAVPTQLSDAEARELDKVPVQIIHCASSATSAPLAGIYFLSYQQRGGDVDMTSCSAGAAVVEMLRNSLNPRESRDEEIAALCRLMAQVPACHLRYTHAEEAAQRIVPAHAA
ncbi:MAG: hypothetical protein ACRDRT_19475, partial [Pseudonocardiaceae bacterium]